MNDFLCGHWKNRRSEEVPKNLVRVDIGFSRENNFIFINECYREHENKINSTSSYYSIKNT